MADAPSALSASQVRQLGVLKAVHDNPQITGIWNGGDCDALVAMGYAERHEVHGIWLVHITPAGVEKANALGEFWKDAQPVMGSGGPCMSCGGNDGYGPAPHHAPGCYFASNEDAEHAA